LNWFLFLEKEKEKKKEKRSGAHLAGSFFQVSHHFFFFFFFPSSHFFHFFFSVFILQPFSLKFSLLLLSFPFFSKTLFSSFFHNFLVFLEKTLFLLSKPQSLRVRDSVRDPRFDQRPIISSK